MLAGLLMASATTEASSCKGGSTLSAYYYINSAGGIELDSSYAYTAYSGTVDTCNDKKEYKVGGRYAVAMRSLFSRYSVVVQSLFSRYSVAIQSLFSRYLVAIQWFPVLICPVNRKVTFRLVRLVV